MNVAGQKVLKIDEHFFLPISFSLLAHAYLKCIIGNHDWSRSDTLYSSSDEWWVESISVWSPCHLYAWACWAVARGPHEHRGPC